jgi:hypothetical protein
MNCTLGIALYQRETQSHWALVLNSGDYTNHIRTYALTKDPFGRWRPKYTKHVKLSKSRSLVGVFDLTAVRGDAKTVRELADSLYSSTQLSGRELTDPMRSAIWVYRFLKELERHGVIGVPYDFMGLYIAVRDNQAELARRRDAGAAVAVVHLSVFHSVVGPTRQIPFNHRNFR